MNIAIKKNYEVEIKTDVERNEVTISIVDENGNGYMLLRGKIGGCDFMNEAQQEFRLKALSKIISAEEITL